MALEDISFEGTDVQKENSTSDENLKETEKTIVNQEDITSLNGTEIEDVNSTNVEESNKSETNDDNASTGELSEGDQLEVDGVIYTVSSNGDIVDEKGNIFKEAKDVDEWLKSISVEDKNDSITLSSIQDTIGITITDEQGNEIEFTNDAKGVSSYIDSVIELKSKELQDAAINRLYSDNPLLKQFQDYVRVTGSPRGFGEIPDRSNIKLDKNNETQLIAVIKMAAQEFGNKSLNDNYINYLKDSGSLYDEAASQLNALVEKDKNYRKEIETEAARQRQEEAESLKTYWENVNKVINSRIIGGYKIPESFTKEVNGKKVVITPNDFFNYVACANVEDSNGNKLTSYQRDLAELTDEEYLNREMLDAWLMFTGGTYKDLIDMAVKEDKVKKLIVKSKENRSNKTVKVIKKQAGKTSIDDILF